MARQLLLTMCAFGLLAGCAQQKQVVNRSIQTISSKREMQEKSSVQSVGYFQDDDEGNGDGEVLRHSDTDTDEPEPLPKPDYDSVPTFELRASDGEISRLPSPGRTLPELERTALSNNPTISQARARIEAARGQCVQVGLLPNPVVGFTANEIGNEDAAGQHGLFIGKQRITNGKLCLRRKVAQQEIAVLQNELQAQRLRVLTDVRLAFYDLLIEQRRVELAKELERISLEAVKTISELLKNEEATRVELLQAEVEAETAKNGVEIAKNNQDAAWRRLASVIGTPDEPLRTVEGELAASPILNWDEAVQRLRSGSPEIARALAAVEKAKCATQLACAESVPNFNWQAGINYDFASDDPFASLQVSMPVPIHNWNQGNIRTARAEFSAAEQDVARIELDLQSRLAEAFRRYANGSQRAQRYTGQILPKARETLELVYVGYRAGEAQYPYLSLLTAQRTLFNAELIHLDAIRQIWLAHSDVEGMLLSNSLAKR